MLSLSNLMESLYVQCRGFTPLVDILRPGGESGGKKTASDLCLLSCLVCILVVVTLYLCNLVSGCWSILSCAPLDMPGIRGKRI